MVDANVLWRHPALVAVVAAIVVVGAAALLWQWQDSRGDGDVPADAAAVVNGVVITNDALDTGAALLAAFPANGLSPDDRAGMLDYAIDQELLAQEARRRGLEPTGAEVTDAIAELVAGLKASMANGDLPAATHDIIERNVQAGRPLDTWVDDPVMRAAFADMLARGALTRDVAAEAGRTATDAGDLAGDLIADLVRELRASGDVRIVD